MEFCAIYQKKGSVKYNIFTQLIILQSHKMLKLLQYNSAL